MILYFALLTMLEHPEGVMPAGQTYEVNRHTINNGGDALEGVGFQLNGSLSQTDASQTMTGQSYQITGGFWQGNNDLIYTDAFE